MRIKKNTKNLLILKFNVIIKEMWGHFALLGEQNKQSHEMQTKLINTKISHCS